LGLIRLDAAGVSRDPTVVRDYESDPLVFHGRMTVGQLREMFAAMDRVVREAGAISLPMLVLHGEADQMTDPQGSRQLFELVVSADKSLTIYPGLYHEIFNEPEKLSVYTEVLDWCDQRVVAG
ncbi:MAG: serine aminopeptidase domain-containing protein, partial [Halioglobus sp.]